MKRDAVSYTHLGQMLDTLEYDYETLHTRMREQAFLNAGLHITIEDKRPESADKPEKERYDSRMPPS